MTQATTEVIERSAASTPSVLRSAATIPGIVRSTAVFTPAVSAQASTPTVSMSSVAMLRGPKGDSGDAHPSTFSTVNKETATIAKGSACASHSTGVGVVKASAADGSRQCIGLMTDNCGSLDAGVVQTAGPFEMDDWSAVTGSEFLTASAIYYLDVISGKLTIESPTENPAVSQKVGKAVSPTVLNIERGYPVQL